jgi:hypothetical protein
MDLQTRRALVLEFIRTHRGCMKEDVVEGLKNQMSRVPVFDTLKELLQDGSIRDESTSRRDHKLYVNDDNLLVSVPRELEEFETAFNNLLHNSVMKIIEKDFSVVSKRLGIQESDPDKWSGSNIALYSSFELERWKEYVKNAKKFDIKARKSVIQIKKDVAKLKKCTAEVRKTLNLLNKTQDMPPGFLYKMVQIDKLEKKEIIERSLKIIKEAESYVTMCYRISEIHQKRSSYDVSDFQITLLAHGAVVIFYLFRDTIFYRSIIWSSTIPDGETLKKLYTNIYTSVANLQLYLIKFLKSTRFRLIRNPLEYKDSIEYIIQFASVFGHNTLASYILYYYEMGMLATIDSIVTSISKINKEIKDYGYSNPMFNQLEKGLHCVMELKESETGLQESRIRLQEFVDKLQMLLSQNNYFNLLTTS